MTEDEIKAVSYSVGMSVAGSLMQQDLENIDPQVMAEAIADTFAGKSAKYSPEEANQIIQQYLQKVSETKFEKNKEAGDAFLSMNKTKPGVLATPSGLQYKVVQQGSGEHPTDNSTVEVHYVGRLIDGRVFDSSVERGTPATFGVNQVIPGWTEALKLMTPGAKFELYIPQNLAYGAHPHPGGMIEPYMTLIFDVELIAIH